MTTTLSPRQVRDAAQDPGAELTSAGIERYIAEKDLWGRTLFIHDFCGGRLFYDLLSHGTDIPRTCSKCKKVFPPLPTHTAVLPSGNVCGGRMQFIDTEEYRKLESERRPRFPYRTYERRCESCDAVEKYDMSRVVVILKSEHSFSELNDFLGKHSISLERECGDPTNKYKTRAVYLKLPAPMVHEGLDRVIAALEAHPAVRVATKVLVKNEQTPA